MITNINKFRKLNEDNHNLDYHTIDWDKLLIDYQDWLSSKNLTQAGYIMAFDFMKDEIQKYKVLENVVNEEITHTLQQDNHDKLKITLPENLILKVAKKMFKCKTFKDISSLGSKDYDQLIKKLYTDYTK